MLIQIHLSIFRGATTYFFVQISLRLNILVSRNRSWVLCFIEASQKTATAGEMWAYLKITKYM